MDAQHIDDRRRDERFEKQTFARISAERPDSEDHALGIVSNVSVRGLGIRTPNRFFVGESVVLRVAAGNQLHNMRVEVRRAEPTDNGLWDVGVEFDPNTGPTQQFLEEFLPCTLLRSE